MHAKSLVSMALMASLVSPVLWADNFDPNPNQPMMMGQSEGMQVYTLPDGRIHAEINYQNEDSTNANANTGQKFSFEGSQAEVREQIQKNTQLPADKKQTLLQSLEMKPEALFNQPMPGGNPFDDPFFKDSPFGNDFFKDFFKGMPSFTLPPGFGQMPPLPVPEVPSSPPAGKTSSPSSGQGGTERMFL
jgi:hypothetical protein